MAIEEEYVDFDDLIDDEDEEMDDVEEASSEDDPFDDAPKKKVKKESNTKGLLLKSVLPATITLIVGAGVGLVLGASMGGSSDTTAKKQDVSVAAISGKTSLSNRLQSLSTSQIRAKDQQIADLTENGKVSSGTDDLVVGVNNILATASTTTIEKLMKAVLDEKPGEEETARINRLKSFFAVSQTEATEDDNVDQIQVNLENFVKNGSLSKSLDIQTAKAGNSFVSLVSYDKRQNATYQVITPVVTDDNLLLNVIYTVKLDPSNKVIAISYNGYVGGNFDPKGYFESLGSVLKGEINIEDGTNETDLPQNTGTDETNNKELTEGNTEDSENSDESESSTSESSDEPADSSKSTSSSSKSESSNSFAE